ncbi:RHS repeat-associated core domain-containing protein [Bacteroides heparinolyticus]|uniref:RHS repeat-associated core domain-containing protein n=1 Tax=Prevotella heparinolytica TaxID=28113 RepID=UPI0035A06BC5
MPNSLTYCLILSTDHLGKWTTTTTTNMNGRMYDPVMSGFLSSDSYIQSPDFSQSFNRYAYCLNNPLKYVDPDGEWIQYVIGGILGGINGYSIGKAGGLEGWDLVWSTVGGSAVGVFTAGIGTAVSGIFSNVAAGTIVGGAASGAVSGSAFGTASAYATGARGADLTNAFFNGLGGGLLGGAAGSALGGYVGGGWGALAGGFASSSIASAFQYDSFRDIHWGNVILNGVCGAAMGFSAYHAATAYSFHESGLKSTLSYKQYSKMIGITQRSMMTNREAKFVAYSDGSSISRLGSAHHANSEGISYENAIFDYHTHPSPANTLADGEGFSTYQSASETLGNGRKSDEYARIILTNKKKYSNPMYLGTREGHFWYMNSGGSGTRGMVNNFDHSFVFFYYQRLFMLKFFSN